MDEGKAESKNKAWTLLVIICSIGLFLVIIPNLAFIISHFKQKRARTPMIVKDQQRRRKDSE